MSQRRRETYTARRLRKELSLPEVLLWQQIRAAKLGLKFRRQHPIGPYVADFFCAALRLAVEIDGEAHDRGNRLASDEARNAYMAGVGLTVLRIPAVDILKDMDGALSAIRAAAEAPLHRASAVPLPAGGEDLG